MNIYTLKNKAELIPDLGKGGKSIKENLILSSFSSPKNTAIIDIAPYLGSTTAYLALGARISKKNLSIYSIDKWLADEDYVEKAKKYHEMDLELNSDLKKMWEYNIKDFKSDSLTIKGFKTDILKFKYRKKEKISVYVDDICNNKERFDYAIKTFMPYFIPRVTIMYLMDYFFFLRKNVKSLSYQKDFMNINKQSFLNLGRIGESPTCCFLYLGKSKLDYPEGDYND